MSEVDITTDDKDIFPQNIVYVWLKIVLFSSYGWCELSTGLLEEWPGSLGPMSVFCLWVMLQ